jgi:hypothetical protein
MAMSNDLENATINEIAVPPALLAPASAHGRFVVIMSSSVTGEIARRSVRGRMPAFAEAVRMLRERAGAEASHSVAAMHGETITVAIESDIG